MDKASPIHNVTDFTLADAVRLARKRTPSDFKTILNYSNTLSDGLKIRRGYDTFTGIVWPTVPVFDPVHGVWVEQSLDASSCDVPIGLPIRNPGTIDNNNPDRLDAFILCMRSIPQVYMYPYWRGATKQNSSMALNESLVERLIPGGQLFDYVDVTLAVNSMKVAFWTRKYSLNSSSNCFKGWKFYNEPDPAHTPGRPITSTIVTSSSYNVNTDEMTFTFVDDINGGGLNWNIHDVYKLFHSYHDRHDFNPFYNNSLANPPCAVADDSLIYFSGGQGADADAQNSLMGSIIYPRMNKTFFGNVVGRSFTIDGTYVSEERCKAFDLLNPALTHQLGSDYTFDWTAGGATSPKVLEVDKTYWVAIAAIYDGGQIGELQRYETVSKYWDGAGAVGNYNVSGYVYLNAQLKIAAGNLNKSIRGFAIYLAQDSGDTRVSGRQSSYFNVGQISLVDSTNTVETDAATLGWTYSGNNFLFPFLLTGSMWNARGNTYETDSGMAEIQTDTSYSYSGRKIVGGRHYLYNVYVTSELQSDKQNIFTNPEGQNASINSGIIQTRIFPNEKQFYRIGVEPNLGTKINAIIPRGFDEMLVIKDRGIVDVRTTTTQDLVPELINRIVDHRIGCSTFHGYALSNREEIFFVGYDDCYLFNPGQLLSLTPLIEKQDKRDWLYTYREVLTNSDKESTTVIWLPQRYIMFDFGQQSGKQYILDEGGWTQAAYHQSNDLTSTEFFQFPSYLRNGTVIAIGVPGSTPNSIRQFQNPLTGAFYTTDAGIAIKTQLDTDYFNFGHDKDFVLNKIIFNVTFDGTPSGQLDATLYRDRLLVRTYTLDHTKYRRFMNSVVGDPKIGFEWRFTYNNNASPEVQSGTQLQIDSIEIYGEIRSRSKRATEQVTVRDSMIWDVDTWDGGKSWGS